MPPARDWSTAVLPQGESIHVYYQSPVAVPNGRVDLKLKYPDGDPLEPTAIRRPDDTEPFELGGQHIRPLYVLTLDVAGEYQVMATNMAVMSDTEVAQDRVVFAKSPDTFDEASNGRRIIHAIGATITVVIVIILYVLHGLALGRRSRRAGTSPV